MPFRLLFRFLTLITIAAPVLASAQSTGSAWEVTEAHAFAVDGQPVALSPDGAWIAGIGPEHETFCVWDTETFEPTCAGEVPAIVANTITWSPDSSAVAFSEDAPRYLADSDIHVFEVETGELSNLTDDGFNGTFFGAEEAVNVDLAPTWSPDGQQLVFARTVSGGDIEDPGTVLMTIPRSGGEPEEILRLAPPYPMPIISTMTWLEDDSILFSIWKVDESDGQNGLWRTSLDGGIEPVIPGTRDDDIMYPTVVSTTPDSTSLSIVAPTRFYNGDMDQAFWLSDTEGTTPVSLMEMANLPEGTTVLAAPGFSPDGSAIAFVTSTDDTLSLTIASMDTGETAAVATVDSRIPSAMDLIAIDWAENGTIFVGSVEGGTLFTVESRP